MRSSFRFSIFDFRLEATEEGIGLRKFFILCLRYPMPSAVVFPIRKSKIEGSFTLIECLIALVIFATGLTMIVGAFSVGIKATSVSKQYAVATRLMQRKIAELESEEISELPDEDSGDFSDLEGDDEHRVENYSGFEWETEVEEISEEVSDLYRVTIRILWEERGSELSLEVVKLMADRGGEEEKGQ